ncbi:unnamed protein product [Amoebophrya sp. A25]|nr:unnamed protein product [Amoebophrya sp. A25]|eukprot:GSA25T00003623001.1
MTTFFDVNDLFGSEALGAGGLGSASSSSSSFNNNAGAPNLNRGGGPQIGGASSSSSSSIPNLQPQKEELRCQNCGSLDVQLDPFSGDNLCGSCGVIVQENRLVAEVGFQEGAGGKKAVIGQSITWGPGGTAISAAQRNSSRDITLARAKRNVEAFAGKLRIHGAHQDQALRIFNLAVDKQFNKGRKNMLLAAACLYIVCRSNRSPHLLIDFADACEFSVRDIGQTYIKLVSVLSLDDLVNVPMIDPSLFMERFAFRMDLGNKTGTVANTAVRLVQQMKRDWLQEGRRPTGLCGAALLVAARWHGFERSPEQVANIVMMAESTLRRRLYEMRTTTVAGMTKGEVMAGEEKVSLCLPPCAKPAILKAHMAEQAVALALEYQQPQEALTDGNQGEQGQGLEQAQPGEQIGGAESSKKAADARFGTSGESIRHLAADLENVVGAAAAKDAASSKTSGANPTPTSALGEETTYDVDHAHLFDVDMGNLPGGDVIPQSHAASEYDAELRAALIESGDVGEVEESLSDVEVDEACLHTENEEKSKRAVWREIHKNQLEEIHYKTLKRQQEREKRIALQTENRRLALTDGYGINTVSSADLLDGVPSSANNTDGFGDANLGGPAPKKRKQLGKRSETAKNLKEAAKEHFHTSKIAEAKFNLDEWDSLFQ